MEEARSQLAAWETFFFLIGSSGAALTGLQFVVIALIADSRRKATTREIQAFGTPTIVHFCAVLLLAAMISAPWHTLSRLALLIGLYGASGFLYTLITFLRARRLKTYLLVFEDLLWHVGLPLLSYALTIMAAFVLQHYAHRSLFIVGFASLMLLFIGIHNAWDSVTYITIELGQKRK